MSKLKAPFPYFGGKAKAVPMVWSRLGKCDHYIEPFCGSMAMLLGCPDQLRAKRETVNDNDCWLVNAWRALKHNPDAVARALDEPLFELNMHAYARQCRDDRQAFYELFRDDSEYHDVERAARWLSGMSAAIGDSFVRCHNGVPTTGTLRGVHKISWRGRLDAIFGLLSKRLRDVTVCSGDWSRVVGNSHLFHGTQATGLFLDPPYLSGDTSEYAGGNADVVGAVVDFCQSHGDDPRLRICLAGHMGDYHLEGWEFVQWERQGGYANQGGESNANDLKKEEGLWFSPHCLEEPRQQLLI